MDVNKEMKSFRWQAQVWEEEDSYDIKVSKMAWGSRLHPTQRRFIDQCFSEERTKSWSTRLVDYAAYYALRRAGPIHPPGIGNRPGRRGWPSAERFLPDGREPGNIYQKFHALGLSLLLQNCKKARIGTEFHGFMDLPRELRDMIYSHAVGTDKRFIMAPRGPPPPYTDEHGIFFSRYVLDGIEPEFAGRCPSSCRNTCDSTPRLGRLNLLMGVCRTIQAEAAKVFFSRNQLIFPVGQMDYPMGFNELRRFEYWL